MITKSEKKRNVTAAAPACADLPQAAAGLRAADGEGGGHDLRQLEGAHHVQHQTAQVNTEESGFQCGMNLKSNKKNKRLKQAGLKTCLSVAPCRALRVRKKMSGDRMPVKMIGDILTNQLPHMQPYIRSHLPAVKTKQQPSQ